MSIIYKRLDWDWKWVFLGAFIAFVIIVCSSWVDHTVDYHVNNPIDQENNDRQQAERDSKDNNVSSYTDHNGEKHTLYDGGEIASSSEGTPSTGGGDTTRDDFSRPAA